MSEVIEVSQAIQRRLTETSRSAQTAQRGYQENYQLAKELAEEAGYDVTDEHKLSNIDRGWERPAVNGEGPDVIPLPGPMRSRLQQWNREVVYATTAFNDAVALAKELAGDVDGFVLTQSEDGKGWCFVRQTSTSKMKEDAGSI